MLNTFKQSIHYESDGGKSRMVLCVEEEIPLISYQAEMLRTHDINGIIGLDTRYGDNQLQLIYDTSDGWWLSDLLDRKTFSKEEFEKLIDRWVSILTECDTYLLDIHRFVLDERYILMNRDMEPQLLYVPIDRSEDIHQRFQQMLMHLLVYRIQIQEGPGGYSLSEMINYLKRDSFNIYSFQKALAGWRSSGEKMPTPPEREESLRSGNRHPKGERSLKALIPEPEAPMIHPRVSEPAYEPVWRSDPPASFQPKEEREKDPELKHPLSSYGIALVFQGVLMVIASYGFGPVYAMTEDAMTAYGVLGLLFVSIDGLFLRQLFKASNRKPVKKEKTKEKASDERPLKAYQPKASEPVAQGTLFVPSANFDKQILTNYGTVPEPERSFEMPIPSPQMSTAFPETEVLCTLEQEGPFLVREGRRDEVISLKQSIQVLGRQPSVSDIVVMDPSMGRMHAEITVKQGRVEVRDLNSRNGTFINDRQISGPQRHPVEFGDRVRFANVEYCLQKERL